MKKIILPYIVAAFISLPAISQVQIDKPVELTGTTGQRSITHLEAPVNGTDAVNKDYVDAKVAAAGGSGPTMVTDESASSYSYGAAIRYCNSLNSGGFTDWYLPKAEDLLVALSKGGVVVLNNASANFIWATGPVGNRSGNNPGTVQSGVALRLSDGVISGGEAQATSYRVRCVR